MIGSSMSVMVVKMVSGSVIWLFVRRHGMVALFVFGEIVSVMAYVRRR